MILSPERVRRRPGGRQGAAHVEVAVGDGGVVDDRSEPGEQRQHRLHRVPGQVHVEPFDRLARPRTGLMGRHLPELGEKATLFSLQTMVLAGALSAYRTPPPSLAAAYQAAPELARLHLEMAESLNTALTAPLLGVLPRD